MSHIQKSQEACIGAKDVSIATIRSLKLIDFMAFVGEHDLEFSDKNIIVGENGAGKTSIFEAILLSLGENGRNKKLDKYINKGASSCTIILDALLTTGDSLIISTTISNEGRRCEKHIEIGEASYDNTAAVNFLRSCNFDVFAQVAFLSQSNDGALISDSPTQTFKNVRGILKSDFFVEHDLVCEDIKSKKNEMAEFNDKSNELSGSIKSLEEIVNGFEEAISNEVAIKPPTESLSELEEQLKDVTLKLGAVHERSFRIVAKQRHINEIKAEISSLSSQIESSKAALSRSEVEKAKVESALANIKLEDVSKLQSTLDSLQGALMEAAQKLSEAEANKKISKSKFDAIKSGKCPTCGSTFTTDDIKQFEDNLKAISAIVDETSKEIDKLAGDRDKALNAVREATHLEKDYSVYNTKLSGINSSIESQTSNLAMLEESLSSKKATLAEKEEAFEAYKSEDGSDGDELNTQLSEINDKIKSIKAFETQKERLDSLKSQIAEHKATIAKLKADKSKVGESIASCTKDLDLYEEAKNVFATKLPAFFIKSMIETIEAGMTDIVKQFNYGYVKVELTEDADGLIFMLCEDNFEIMMSELSQFEKSMMQFSLKVVLAKLLGNKVVCFDEPDHAACQSNELNMANFLKGISEEMQLILISHSQTTKEVLFDAGAQIIEVVKEASK